MAQPPLHGSLDRDTVDRNATRLADRCDGLLKQTACTGFDLIFGHDGYLLLMALFHFPWASYTALPVTTPPSFPGHYLALTY